MLRRIVGIVAVVWGCWSSAGSASAVAEEISLTSFSTLEAVFETGAGAYSPMPRTEIYVAGVVINNPADMLDSAWNAEPGKSGAWQTFIQALQPGRYTYGTAASAVSFTVANDFGGAALYMGSKKYGSSGPSHVYTTADAWNAELARLGDVRVGDVVLVRARAPGLFYGGKYNINEQHKADSAYDFDIKILQRGTTPAAAKVDLKSLKSAGTDPNAGFLFDATRATGCERYQASRVELTNVRLDAAASTLGNNKPYTIHQTIDGQDYTFTMLLGLDPNLTNASKFSLDDLKRGFCVTGIWDQEDGNSQDGWKDGYRLWVTNAANISVVPEPGAWALLATGLLAAGPMLRRRLRRRSA